jgi:DNA-3-methyladenine glycosylase II
VRDTLTSYLGIGPWTADIYLMFGLGRPDIWPVGDLGLQAGAQLLLDLRRRPSPRKLADIGEAWRPYRSSAALLLWQFYGAMR